MDYSTFYEIASYGNSAWNGSFSAKEVACNAYDYKVEYDASFRSGKLSRVIKELLKLLLEDDSEDCIEWAHEIMTSLKLTGWNYLDFSQNVSTMGALEKKKWIDEM